MTTHPSAETNATIREWLKQVMALTGLKATPLAQKVGLAPSTLLRVLAEETASLERRSIDRIVNVLGVAPPAIYGATGATPVARQSPALAGFAEELHQAVEPPLGLSPTEAVWTIKGHGLNLAGLLPGDVITADSATAPADRDIVVVHLIDEHSGSSRAVLRIFEPPFVVTETTDASARRRPQLVDNRTVAIWGTMTKMRRNRSA
jgi:Cro/C1-type HTH DNA-binding domain